MTVNPLDAPVFPYEHGIPHSLGRFADGAHFRIEIPSVEGPAVMEAAIDAALHHGVTINRVSQGSGAMLLKRSELTDMAALGREHGIEVCLFVGPRELFDIGVGARSSGGSGLASQLRGNRQLSYGVEDVLRSIEAGIRSFLVPDIGLLAILVKMQHKGTIPSDCVWKMSVALAPSNPASLRVLADLGASTVNVPSDVSFWDLAEMRAAVDLPLDLYVESSDTLGGVVRGQEIADLVAIGAPMYTKFGLRNARDVYPSADHIVEEASNNVRAKVSRAAVSLEWLARCGSDAIQSKPFAKGLAVPQ
jgi:hypothetical protein